MPKLSVIYRAYPLVSKKTLIDFSNKTEMMKLCLKSLKNALKHADLDFEFTFISDNCSDEQIDLVRSYFSNEENRYKEILLSGLGNYETFRIQLKEACMSRSEFVLLLEDDYYVSLNDIAINIDALKICNLDYSTFFYPADADPSFGNMRCKDVNLTNDISAIELPSTTLTFFARRETLLKDKNLFLTFSNGNHDSSLWLRLTGNFFSFLLNITKPLFYKNIKLYLSIIYRYIRFYNVKRASTRKLFFIGDFSSVHLDSGASLNTNNIKYKLKKVLKEND